MTFLIDLDGTLLNNDRANLDAVDFIREVQFRGIDFMIMTNSVSSPQAISQRLKKVAINVPSELILNPIVSINSYISNQGINSAFIVGSQQEIDQVCVTHEAHHPEIILLLDFEKANVDHQRLQNIYAHLQNNVPIVSASGAVFYLQNGAKKIDTGAFMTMFEALTNTKIPVFGKPSQQYFIEGLHLLKSQVDETIVIGDDWQTDILGANALGCRAVLVKSGKYCHNDEQKCQPDLVVRRLADILIHFE